MNGLLIVAGVFVVAIIAIFVIGLVMNLIGLAVWLALHVVLPVAVLYFGVKFLFKAFK